MASGGPGGVRGVGRVLAKLQRSIENGNYYEAHQMYKTLYFRYTNQEKYAEAIDLLYDGAMKLSEHGQHQSAADLCMLLVETLKKADDDVDDAHIKKLGELFSALRPDQIERENFLNAALQWSSKNEKSYKSGHPSLHSTIGECLWKEKNYAQARFHFVHSHSGESCGLMLVEYSTSRGFPSEVDLFITQAVLQYLCLSNLPTATVAFKIYTANHPGIRSPSEPPVSNPRPPFLMPLLNFVWFLLELLLTVETRKLALFTVLCEQYRVSIGRDPAYRKYLDRIAQLFFGVPPPSSTSRGAGGGIFGNLMASIMGGGAGGGGGAIAGGSRGLRSSMVNGTARNEDDDDDDDDDDDEMSFEDMLSSFMRPPTAVSASAPKKGDAKKTLKPDDDLD